MTEQIFYIDRSDIREGKVGAVKAQMQTLSKFVASNMPQLISYGFYLDENTTRMTVVAIHPDTASLEAHLETGGPAFREFSEFINLRTIQVYGQPSERALDLLHRKAEMLGDDASVEIHERQAGFTRLASSIS